MPQLLDYDSRDVLSFGGAQTLPDPPDVKFPTGLYARNVEFITGTVQTRRGFGTALSLGHSGVTGLYNWNSGLGNILALLVNGTGVKFVLLSGLKAVTGAANNGAGLIRLTVVGHGWSTGHEVVVDRVGGISNASGRWTITVIDANTIDLQGSTWAGTYTSGGSAGRVYSIVSTSNGPGVVFTDAGARLYIATHSSSGVGQGGWVISKQSGNFVADTLFPPPLTYTPSAPTEPVAGNVSAGLHRWGYILESRGGALGRPSPDSGIGIPSSESFNPQLFTATGSKIARVVLNTTWPAWATKVHIIFTPQSSLADYRFVPGAVASLPAGGGAAEVQIDINISDADLLAKGEDASPYLFLQTQKVDGTPPFTTSAVVQLGTRMGYVTTIPDNNGNPVGALMVSEPGWYQHITPNQHLVQLPGQRDIVTAFTLVDGAIYILGPHWTYATVDTGVVPSRWPTPKQVDGRHGTLSARGVDVSAARDFAWVASQDGLYLFNGSYPVLPVSYYQQSEWDRINWNAPWAVTVKDHPTEKKVYVLAALDGAASPSHLLVWSYARGLSPALVDYAIYDLSGYSLGSVELVQNDLLDQVTAAKRKVELWTGPYTTAAVGRALTASDTDPYKDFGTAIHSTYDPAMFPGRVSGVPTHHGAHMRISGSGTASLSVTSMDGGRAITPIPVVLAVSPDKDVLRRWKLNSELARLRVDCTNGYFRLSSIKWYYSPWVSQR